MSTLRNKFEQIECFDDLRSLATKTKDGESSFIEFKSLKEGSFNSNNVGETKAVLAKEICAFLNTNDGIVAWGCSCENNIAKIDNDTTENLEEFFDGILQNIVEPSPLGIDFKTIIDDNKTCLVIFVPQSDFAPHRVGSWDADEGKKSKNKKIGRYFQRIGTNSQVMPENIVRAMYLSRGRIPNVSIYTTLKIVEKNKIKMSTFVKPDSQKYIGEYYNSNQILAIDETFHVIKNEAGDTWQEIHDPMISPKNNPIYPETKEYEFLSSYILDDEPDNNYDGNCLFRPVSSLPDKNTHFTKRTFSKIFAIATKSSFSCDSISLKTNNRLYILGSQEYWKFSDYDLERVDILEYIEKEYDFEIYVAKPYRNDIVKDDDLWDLSLQDRKIRTHQIIELLQGLKEPSST